MILEGKKGSGRGPRDLPNTLSPAAEKQSSPSLSSAGGKSRVQIQGPRPQKKKGDTPEFVSERPRSRFEKGGARGDLILIGGTRFLLGAPHQETVSELAR